MFDLRECTFLCGAHFRFDRWRCYFLLLNNDMALFRQIESVVNRIDYRLLHERLGSLPQILLQQLQALADSTLEKCRNLHETCLLRRWI